MGLPELSIRRYVLAFMLNGLLVLLGVIAYQRLGVDQFPNIEFPVVSVVTALPGANPDVVDSSITNVIENAVNSTPGISDIMSTSSPGVSIVAIRFDLGKDVNVAFNEVQAKVNQALASLPSDAKPPVVAKVETGAQPIMWLALQGDRTLQQLNVYARNVIKKRLETIDGVGQVLLGGERKRTIRVNLDLGRMAAFGVTTQDLVTAFKNQNVELPGGFLVGGETEKLIKLDLEAHTLNQLRDMVVSYRDGAPVLLKDVASVQDSLADYRQLARFNGQPTVGIGIVKISNANTVAIARAVQAVVKNEIAPQLPAGMRIKTASNDATFIEDMVRSLQEHLLEGTLLAALVVLLFLKSFRSTVIISLAIPVSLLAAITVMYFLGYTFNSLTLLALLLLIGVVVDDAIVVLENIYRHRQHIDPDPVSAALNGTNQVAFAVLASSLTLVSIFGPVVFMGGIVGMFFKSFAVVVTFGVLASLFVSLTLTPMLASRYLTVSKEHGRIYHTLEAGFQAVDRSYRHLLDLSLRRRWLVMLLATLFVLSTAFFFSQIGKGFVPEEDEGRFMVIFKTPLGSSIEQTDARLRQIEAVLSRHKEIASYFTAIGLGQGGQVNQGIAFVRLLPRDRRHLGQYALMAMLRRELARIPGVQAFPAPVPMVGGAAGGRGEPLQFAVTGPDLREVARLSGALGQRLSALPGMGHLDTDLQMNLPELTLDVDRIRSASLGLSATEVAQAVNVLAGGFDVAKFNEIPGDGERYDVRLKAQSGELRHAADLSRIYLRARDGRMVRLDTVARIRHELGPAVISRYNLQYAANFFGSPTMPLGEAVQRVQQAGASLPPGYHVKMLGQAEEFGKTIGYMVFAFSVALILMYMVLASQFNSFVQPIIIMMAQPLAIVGGIASLWLFGQSLNIYSMIGLVLLVGLVAKNSILLVDIANQARAEGRDIDTALRQAGPLRMRPILMTSLTIILAELPAALGLGAGAETNAPLAIAVIGGMISSTLLSLLVVPVVYSLMETPLQRRRDRRRAQA